MVDVNLSPSLFPRSGPHSKFNSVDRQKLCTQSNDVPTHSTSDSTAKEFKMIRHGRFTPAL